MNRALRAPAVAALLTTVTASGLWAAPQTRSLRHTFPAGAAELQLANLAGRVELIKGTGKEVVVEATIYAEASSADKTRQLLDGMKWVKARDKKGHPEWALSYPVERYDAFHYPRVNKDEDLPAFLTWLDVGHTSTTYRGKRVRLYSKKRASTPTLYADLRIALPAASNVVVRNVVGSVRGGDLEGTLTVDTGAGDVRLASYAGRLVVDTGSGDVTLGSVKGETLVDTGSGDVSIKRLVGNGSVDTGSGDVVVENVSAGKLAIDTGSGDVTVRGGVAAIVSADTGSGNVHIEGVELEELNADTGSGNVVVVSSLSKARKVVADTGSGDIRIRASANASFDIESDQGSGDLVVGYSDATLRRSGRKVVGARRGDGRTVIRVETGSGDCVISPKG